MSTNEPESAPDSIVEAESAGDRDRLISRALADYLDCLSTQEFVDTDAFCRRYPDIALELRPLLVALNKMDELAETSVGAVSVEEDEPLPDKLSGHKILGVI